MIFYVKNSWFKEIRNVKINQKELHNGYILYFCNYFFSSKR